MLILLALELADRLTMKRDLEITREIQGWLMPSVAPKLPGVDIAFVTRPANTVAGIYYDAFLLPQSLQADGPRLLSRRGRWRTHDACKSRLTSPQGVTTNAN